MPSKPKTLRKETSELLRAQIWGHYCNGPSYSKIQKLIGTPRVPKSTIADTINRIKSHTSTQTVDKFKSAPRKGRPPKLSTRATRQLIRSSIRDRHASLRALSTPSKSTHRLCRTTVRVRLREAGKRRCKARKKPWISSKNKKVRTAFRLANKHRNWMRVCWSDESTFEVGFDSRTCYVTRSPDEAYKPECLQPTFKSGRVMVGVWACFMGAERGPLIILEKGARLNASTYLDNIWIPHFLPFYRKMRMMYGREVSMQEDGAPYHHSKLLRLFKSAWDINLLEWPPQSPDLSPIENIWFQLKLRISARRHEIRTYAQMVQAIQEEWEALPRNLFAKYAATMKTRLMILKIYKGGLIAY